ncbi:MAG TPA: HIT family protein [Nitrospiraceae bacterium]|nr:HIT family protein [Nitrospiraceae bacterium]
MSRSMKSPVCRACSGQWPPRNHYIADCGHTKAYLHDDQFFTGWTLPVLKRHATELFHLSPEERTRLIEEVSQVASHLADELRPVKINYELLGNQLPHIHWHLIPRLVDDPAPLEPVWRVPHEPRSLSERARDEMISRLRRRLISLGLP